MGDVLQATPSKLHIMAGRSSYNLSGISVDIPDIDSDMQYEPEIDAGEYESNPVVSHQSHNL